MGVTVESELSWVLGSLETGDMAREDSVGAVGKLDHGAAPMLTRGGQFIKATKLRRAGRRQSAPATAYKIGHQTATGDILAIGRVKGDPARIPTRTW